jgi:hypothetical protein
MSTVDDATATMIVNLEARTGRPLADWVDLVRRSGRSKHGEILTWLKSEHGLTHGYANLVALTALRGDDAPSGDALVDAMYAGPKAGLRPLHDAVVTAVRGFGPDVELAPKQAYVSLRRSKQFGTVGPASGGTVEVGFNLPGVAPTDRLRPTSGMCTHRLRIASADELDGEVIGWLRQAYDRA